VQHYFSAAIDHWVGNCQNETSGFAKTLMWGNAINSIQQGNGFAAAVNIGLAKGQGVKHPTATTSIVRIPTSATTMGGEMVVAAEAAPDDCTQVDIDGHTLGLFGGTLKENVHGLRDYLMNALPECGHQDPSKSGVVDAAGSIASEIERLSELHRNGDLGDDEFREAKRKVLSEVNEKIEAHSVGPNRTDSNGPFRSSPGPDQEADEDWVRNVDQKIAHYGQETAQRQPAPPAGFGKRRGS